MLRGERFLREILAGILALLNLLPSLTITFNPLFFVMFLPVGAYATIFWSWIVLKDIPDPFHPGESLFWLTYAIKTENTLLFPSLFSWGLLDSSLLIVGSVIFLVAFATWLVNLSKSRGLLTHGIYGVTRHPQYLGLILLALGVSIRSLRPISLIAWIALLFGYLILASLEERNLLRIYGKKYEEYSNKVAFMIPFLKLNTPEWLSPEKPYRYLLFIMLYLLFTVIIIVGMRNSVFALRGVTY